jgi:hypothetical protein
MQCKLEILHSLTTVFSQGLDKFLAIKDLAKGRKHPSQMKIVCCCEQLKGLKELQTLQVETN